MATFFFCGIGGIGMSSIALYLKKKGHTVLGSDRSFDQQNNLVMKDRLMQAGIILFPQDGTSRAKSTSEVFWSEKIRTDNTYLTWIYSDILSVFYIRFVGI